MLSGMVVEAVTIVTFKRMLDRQGMEGYESLATFSMNIVAEGLVLVLCCSKFHVTL